jgi:hypothetical protein
VDIELGARKQIRTLTSFAPTSRVGEPLLYSGGKSGFVFSNLPDAVCADEFIGIIP